MSWRSQTRQLSNVNIESLKTQRDLYLAFRDLLLRHERESWRSGIIPSLICNSLATSGLSKDTVDSLRKRVESKQKKLETVRINHRAGWEVEDEKLVLGQSSSSFSLLKCFNNNETWTTQQSNKTIHPSHHCLLGEYSSSIVFGMNCQSCCILDNPPKRRLAGDSTRRIGLMRRRTSSHYGRV